MNIIHARTTLDIDEIRNLFREYERFLNVNLEFQDFALELATLPGKYGPPSGVILLARDGEIAIGCGAIRRFGCIEDRLCEMKRLYVRPMRRGQGVGRQIAVKLIQEAVRLGYRTMLLDTLDRLEAATHLYRSLGFRAINAYYENPLPGVSYWTLDLIGPPRA